MSGLSSTVSRVFENPRLVGRFLNRLYFRATNGRFHDGGIDVFDADWDSLVILDACRYDLFESVSTLSGDLKSRSSQASNTVEFLHANVAGRDLSDTVYVTANPQFRKHEASLDATFHAVVDLWDEGWDRVMNTVLPATVTDAAITAAKRYPNKRLFVHYNQPHIPFVGDTGREAFDLDAITAHKLPFWQQPLAGVWDVSDDVIWAAYRENLELVLPHVERLLDDIDGRTVVTSDHGNMIGDRAFPLPMREYGHPHGIYTRELTTVPWLVVSDGDRRTITAGTPSSEETVSDAVDDRLESLGYRV